MVICNNSNEWVVRACPANTPCLTDYCELKCDEGETTCYNPDDTEPPNMQSIYTCVAGEWSKALCADSQTCKSGQCIEKERCDSSQIGETRCLDGDFYEICNSDLTWNEIRCPTSTKCTDNKCRCIEDMTECRDWNSTLYYCKKGEESKSLRCPVAESCGTQTCTLCTENSTFCLSDSQSAVCRVEEFPKITTCAKSHQCEDGECKPILCEKNSRVCIDSTDYLLCEIGKEKVTRSCPARTVCVDNACIPQGDICYDKTRILSIEDRLISTDCDIECDDNKCINNRCEETAKTCISGNTIEHCKKGEFSSIEICPSDKLCINGECLSKSINLNCSSTEDSFCINEKTLAKCNVRDKKLEIINCGQGLLCGLNEDGTEPGCATPNLFNTSGVCASQNSYYAYDDNGVVQKTCTNGLNCIHGECELCKETKTYCNDDKTVYACKAGQIVQKSTCPIHSTCVNGVCEKSVGGYAGDYCNSNTYQETCASEKYAFVCENNRVVQWECDAKCEYQDSDLNKVICNNRKKPKCNLPYRGFFAYTAKDGDCCAVNLSALCIDNAASYCDSERETIVRKVCPSDKTCNIKSPQDVSCI